MPEKYYRRAEFWLALALGPLYWISLWWQLGKTAMWWPWQSPVTFAMLTLVYPLLEEIVFRGGLQGFLSLRATWHWRGVSAANLLTSLIFSLTHVVLRHDPAAVMVIFPSLVFGYFYDRDRTWVPAFYLHAFYNLGYAIFIS